MILNGSHGLMHLQLVGFTDKKLRKKWMDSQGKTWNLIEFANDPDPDVYSGNGMR